MNPYPHAFDGEVVRHDVGTYRYTVVFLPGDIAEQLPFDRHPRLRISGEIGEVSFTGAWQPVRGRWYLMLGKPLLRTAGLAIGDRAHVRFGVDDQESVEVPPVLSAAVHADPAAQGAWARLTVGQQRALAHRVLSAKTDPTVTRRVSEVLGFLRGELELRIGGKSRRT